MQVQISTTPNGSYVVHLGEEWSFVDKLVVVNKARETLAALIGADRCELECSGYSGSEEGGITIKFIDRRATDAQR